MLGTAMKLRLNSTTTHKINAHHRNDDELHSDHELQLVLKLMKLSTTTAQYHT